MCQALFTSDQRNNAVAMTVCVCVCVCVYMYVCVYECVCDTLFSWLLDYLINLEQFSYLSTYCCEDLRHFHFALPLPFLFCGGAWMVAGYDI